MRIARKGLVAAFGTAAAFGIRRFAEGAPEFSYRFGGDQAPEHPMTLRSREVAEKITRESGGRLEISFFPNSTLGSSVDLLNQARLGALEFTLISSNIIQATVPLAGIFSVPFAFPSYKDAWNTSDGPLGDLMRSQIQKAGFYTFAKCWDGGQRQIINGLRPLRNAADFKGMKIRVPAAPMSVAFFKALGASPTPIDGSQVYLSMQTRLIDGAEGGLPFFHANKFYELEKYVSWTNHQWTGYTMLANQNAWDRLPRDLRDIAERNFNAMSALDRADDQRLDGSLEATLVREGCSFNRTDVADLRATIRNAGLYAQWRDSFGTAAWSLLERSVGKL